MDAPNGVDETSTTKSWSSKQVSLEEAVEKIPNGSAVYIGSTAATAVSTLEAMVDDVHLSNIQIIQGIPGGNLPHLFQNADQFRTRSFYSFAQTGYFDPRHAYGATNDNNSHAYSSSGEGLEDYTPVSISAIPRLLQEEKLRVDVAVLKVTPPHKGFVSLGMGVESTHDFVSHASIVIAEVNQHMPWTEGRSKLRVDEIDWWVEVHQPLLTTEQLWPHFLSRQTYVPEVLDQIGKHILKEIPDRATLRFGVSPIAMSVFPFLNQRTDLGLHTDVLTETLFRLHEKGVITNKYKTIDTGRTIVTQAHGSHELYDFLDRNPVVELHPVSVVCDPQRLGKIDNLISVVGALKVDLTGQVATDSIGHKFYGGIWSDDESVRGAKFSKGGKPIVAVPSMSLSGRSNVVFSLPPGTGVSITRSDVEYVVTEYGTAYLYGKSIRERCLALIGIAHPDFRPELAEQAKAHHYLSQSQPAKSFGSIYPVEWECIHTTKKSRTPVFVRPIKAVDEDLLRNFFHKLSDHSVYLRYFRKLKSMPQRILQRTADVDYSSDMALVVLIPPNAVSQELVAIGQWVSDLRTPTLIPPEIAFQVRDDWQGQGLGSYLLQRLFEIARHLGLPKLKADVLNDNHGMKAVFEKSGVPYLRRSDFGVMTYTFDLEK